MSDIGLWMLIGILFRGAGSYNEDGLAGLDRLLDAAGRRGLKLVVTLSDNWNEADGKMAVSVETVCCL